VDEARAVIARLDRIERLQLEGAPGREILAELQALVSEVEAWVAVDGRPDAAVEALDRCRAALGAAVT
jgi:hypothetical protein